MARKAGPARAAAAYREPGPSRSGPEGTRLIINGVYNGNILPAPGAHVNIQPSVMSAPYHHGDLKAALLAYARAQLERQSLHALSMRELAKAAEVSHTAVYRHFADKQALLDAVAAQGFGELQRACTDALQAAAADPRSRLEACGLAYIRYGLEHPRLLIHMFAAAAQPGASATLDAAAAPLFDTLLQVVVQGQAQGRVRAGDPRTVARACWAMVHGLTTLNAAGNVGATPSGQMLQDAAESLRIFLEGVVPARPAQG